MFKRILVPLDGSQRAERAAYVAERLARATGSEVLFTRVVDVPVRLGQSIEMPQIVLAPIEDNLETAQEYLSRFAHRPDFADSDVEIMALEGPVATTLLETAVAESADLIIMCSHGRTGASRWPLGSVAQKLARRSPVPILVLREGGSLPGITSATQRIRPHALVALDGSPFSERALAPAVNLAVGLAFPDRAELHLIHVIAHTAEQRAEEAARVERERYEPAIQDATAYLRALAERAMRETPAECRPVVEVSVLLQRDVAGALIDHAAGRHQAGAPPAEHRPDYDFVAMATHGRGGWQRLMLGSVTERVLHAIRVPLLIVPPESRASRQGSA